MKREACFIFLLLFLSVQLLSGGKKLVFAQTPTATPTEVSSLTSTIAPTETPTPEPTATPESPTDTPAPTQTPTPEPETDPTPTPTITPKPTTKIQEKYPTSTPLPPVTFSPVPTLTGSEELIATPTATPSGSLLSSALVNRIALFLILSGIALLGTSLYLYKKSSSPRKTNYRSFRRLKG